MISIALVVMWLASVTVGVIAAAAMVTYVRRTWQQMRLDEKGPAHEEILDGIERIEVRLSAMSERIERIERERLPPGE